MTAIDVRRRVEQLKRYQESYGRRDGIDVSILRDVLHAIAEDQTRSDAHVLAAEAVRVLR